MVVSLDDKEPPAIAAWLCNYLDVVISELDAYEIVYLNIILFIQCIVRWWICSVSKVVARYLQ